MGNIIASAKKLQNLIGGLVLFVHHSGKDNPKGCVVIRVCMLRLIVLSKLLKPILGENGALLNPKMM